MPRREISKRTALRVGYLLFHYINITAVLLSKKSYENVEKFKHRHWRNISSLNTMKIIRLDKILLLKGKP